jgi:hypothetical protein
VLTVEEFIKLSKMAKGGFMSGEFVQITRMIQGAIGKAENAMFTQGFTEPVTFGALKWSPTGRKFEITCRGEIFKLCSFEVRSAHYADLPGLVDAAEAAMLKKCGAEDLKAGVEDVLAALKCRDMKPAREVAGDSLGNA